MKELNKVRLFWSFVSIKFDELRMLEVKRPIVNFLLLVLGVPFNSTLDSDYPSKHWSYQNSFKEKFELNQRQENFGFLVPTLMLVQEKLNCNSMVEVGGADGIYQSDSQTFWGFLNSL